MSSAVPTESRLRVVLVYPDVLGTYGDRGNAAALLHRARARDLDCEVVEVGLDQAVPRDGDIYLIGGGEDAAMLLAWDRLHRTSALPDAIAGGAVCFGVCAGFQMLGRHFAGPDGQPHEGFGLLDVTSHRTEGPRAVGEVLAESVALPGLGFLTGFENHRGDARLGPDAQPLGRVLRGMGNGDGTEGAVQGRVVGTYLHGPALPRNPALADQLLEWVVGPLPQYDHLAVARLREERRAAALSVRPARRGRRGQVNVP